MKRAILLRRILLGTLSLCVAACAGIAPQVYKHFADDRDSMLVEDLRYSIGDSGVTIVIPAGFVTDYASIPSALWTWMPPHGRYSKAAIIHDYLYWTQDCTKEQADNLLMIAMKESDVSGVDKWIIYHGVDTFGAGPWESNRRLKAEGWIKIIPPEYRNFPGTVSWPAYRGQLKAKNAREAFPVQTAGYCSLGNSNEVPGKAMAFAR